MQFDGWELYVCMNCVTIQYLKEEKQVGGNHYQDDNW